MTFALGEEWCWEEGQACEVETPPYDYKVTWAKEFRYDGGRQRYLDRELDPTDLTGPPLSDTFTTYEGDERGFQNRRRVVKGEKRDGIGVPSVLSVLSGAGDTVMDETFRDDAAGLAADCSVGSTHPRKG